jgi:hypothetical protein
MSREATDIRNTTKIARKWETLASEHFKDTGVWMSYNQATTLYPYLFFLDILGVPRPAVGESFPAKFGRTKLSLQLPIDMVLQENRTKLDGEDIWFVTCTKAASRTVGNPQAFLNRLQSSAEKRKVFSDFIKIIKPAGEIDTSLLFVQPTSNKRCIDADNTSNDDTDTSQRACKKGAPPPPLPPPSSTLQEIMDVVGRYPDDNKESNNDRSYGRDASLIQSIIQKRQPGKNGQQRLLALVHTNLGFDNPEAAQCLMKGTKILVTASNVSEKGGRPTLERRAALHVASTSLFLGTQTNAKKLDIAKALEFGKAMGFNNECLEGGQASAEEMLKGDDIIRPYKQINHATNPSRLIAINDLLRAAFDKWQHNEDTFQTNTNEKHVHVGHHREVWYETVGGKRVARHKKQDGTWHPGRSRGNLTIKDITGLFKHSVEYEQCHNESSAVWNDEKTTLHLCRCIKVPRKVVCVDPIKANVKHSTNAIKVCLLRRLKAVYGHRSEAAVKRLLAIFESVKTLAAETQCDMIEYAGMKVKEDKWVFYKKECAFGTCTTCGVRDTFREILENLAVSKQEKIEMMRFQKVERSWGEVEELVKITVTIAAAIKMAEEDIAKFNVHIFKDKWARLSWNMMIDTQLPRFANIKADFASGLTFSSIETLTCSPDNFAYLEIFFVTLKRRKVAGVQIFTNLVFYCFGEADSKYKGNDVAVHEANEKHCIKILIRDWNVDGGLIQTDGCGSQYNNRRNMYNISTMKKNTGLKSYSAIICEPGCGKSQCDGASKRVTRAIADAVEANEYIPNGFEAWLLCRRDGGIQPKHAAMFKHWEEIKDGYSLDKYKGIYGEDKCYYFFDTSDEDKFEVLSAKYPGEIVLVDRSTQTITAVEGIKKNRFYSDVSNGGEPTLGLQEAPCHCPRCQKGLNCMHDNVSGKSKQSSLVMRKQFGFMHKIHAYEGEPVKEVERCLVKAETDGAISYLNSECSLVPVKVRALVLFTQINNSWGAGVVTSIGPSSVVVDVLVEMGGMEVKKPGVIVQNNEIKATSNSQPQKQAVRITVDAATLAKLDALCIS